MPIPKNYTELIVSLIDGTKAGQVSWSSQNPSIFALHFDDFSFQVLRYGGEYTNESPGVGCALLNDKGDVIDNFSTDSDDGDYPVLEELYELARRDAFKIDQAIQKLTSKLKEGKLNTPAKPTKSVAQEFNDDDIPF